ncbi:MAG: ABC transporter substrate-binding protein [Thermodesulfobacteriota bacterium]
MLKRALLSVMAITLLLTPIASTAAAPTDLLSGTIDAVLEVLKDPAYKGEAHTNKRRTKIKGIIAERFSYVDMAKRSMGKHWKKRSDAEKKEFSVIFGKLISLSYITKLEGYTNEKVLYETETIAKTKAMVKTKIMTKSGTDIPVDYRLLNKGGGNWMVYDVVIEGISLVRNYRTQFNKSLMQGSYEELLKKLKSKVKNA